MTRDEAGYGNTIQGRAIIRWSLFRDKVQRVWPQRALIRVSRMVPRALAYWVVIRVGNGTMRGDDQPSLYRLTTMIERWEQGEGA